MQWKESILLLALGAVMANAQSSSSVVPLSSTASDRPTLSFNSASTDVIISTAAPQTANVFSATGTSQPPVSTPPFVNVSSVPAAASTSAQATPSSNFTLPSATATATLPPNFVVQSSVPYVMSDVVLDNMPDFTYSLLNESVSTRQSVCDQQTHFCQVAGCATPNATINENFCNVETMGTRCTCNKGDSNLQQWKWPVQKMDCLMRGGVCGQACTQPDTSIAQRSACKEACDNNFRNTCGLPGQYSANYAVSKQNQKPALAMVQGGTAGNGGLALSAATGSLSVVVACLAAFLLM